MIYLNEKRVFFFRKVRSAIIRACSRLASNMRIAIIRMSSSGVRIPWSVTVGASVRIRVTDGGLLTIGRDVSIGDSAVLVVQGGICDIGERTFIGHGCTIVAHDSIIIGASSLLGEYTSVRDQDHRIDLPGLIAEAGMVSARVQIGRGAWLGARTTILKGSQVEDGAVVGANSVVRGRLLARSVNAGVPAKQIRMRD